MAGLSPKETEAPEVGEKEYIVGNYKFKEENGTLYFSNNNSDSFQELFSQVKDFKFSPEAKKMAYFSDYEIWIMFLDKVTLDKEAGDKMFLIRLSEKIDNVFENIFAAVGMALMPVVTKIEPDLIYSGMVNSNPVPNSKDIVDRLYQQAQGILQNINRNNLESELLAYCK